MQVYKGRIVEIILGAEGWLGAKIACPPGSVPLAGQYVSAREQEDLDTPLATILYCGGFWESGFIAAPPVPHTWTPGMRLFLRGPLGKGFQLPAQARRIGLAALGGSVSRLLPLGLSAIESGHAVALFTGAALPQLPSALEAYPLAALADALPWADYLAVDTPLEKLNDLRAVLGLEPPEPLPCDGQMLIVTPMPCASIAECGACAVLGKRRTWLLACQDGPVFDFKELEW
ncbi:MAG: hypothetical protein EHM41_17005 [Chloroflexi bacterium]|nr:MAG: hypothetical protein EHM41_17005 [Chloroflexota bacterium]